MLKFVGFLSLLALLGAPPVLAAAPDYRLLARSPQWLALLHFADAKAGASYVDDPGFFMDVDGVRQPAAELAATVAALRERPELACKYPGRYQWLVEQQLLSTGLLRDCAEYQQWRAQLQTRRVSLVLAASYLNSPSSMYGHTFLRLDPAGERGDNAFLSYALNFGAAIPAGENGMLYAYRGLLGGYPGLFSMQPYYQKIQEYSRLENRDMWEYKLNLSAVEIDRMLAHIWELKGVNFDYYFFDENCSYRLLELLEVARPGVDLTASFDRAAMPVDTVREVLRKGMVEHADYRPSKRLELEGLLAVLDSGQQALVRQLATQPSAIDGEEYLERDDGEREQLALAAYRLLRYRRNKAQRSGADAEHSLNLLRQVQRNASGLDSDSPMSKDATIDLGHPTSLFAANLGQRDERQYVELEWRISYHDALDRRTAYPVGASLEMGRIVLRGQEGEGLRVERLEPLAIRSLAPITSFFRPLSWQVSAGLLRLDDSPEQSLVGVISGGAGTAVTLAGGLAYAMPSLSAEYNRDASQHSRLAPGLRLGQLWQGRQLSAELAFDYFDFAGDGVRKGAALTGNWALSNQQALRLAIDYRHRPWGESRAVSLSWRWYL